MSSGYSIEDTDDDDDLLTLCALVEDYKIEINDSNKEIKELKDIILSNEEINALQHNQINELSDSLLLLDSELLDTQNNLLLKDNDIILLKEQLMEQSISNSNDSNNNNLINIENIDKMNEYENIINSQIKEIKNYKKIICKNILQIEEYEELLNKQQTEILDLGYKVQEFEKKQHIPKNETISHENLQQDRINNSTTSTIYNNCFVDENFINNKDQINKSHTPHNIISSILNRDSEEYNSDEFDIINEDDNINKYKNKSIDKWKRKENLTENKNYLSNNNWIEGGKKNENYERQYINANNNNIVMNNFDNNENKYLPPLPPSGSTFNNIKQKATDVWKSVSSSRSSSPIALTQNNLNNINSKKNISYGEFDYQSEDTSSSICSIDSNKANSKLSKKISITRGGKTVYPIILQEGIELELDV
jgi:hypothetical protein